MKKIVFIFSFALLSLTIAGQSKLVSGSKASTAKKTTVTSNNKGDNQVKKGTKQPKAPSVRGSSSNRYASSGYMEISGISFANVDNSGHIIDDYGSTLYVGDLKYLKPKIFYRGLSSQKREITLDIKIINEDGTVQKGTGTKSGFAFSQEVNVEPGSGKSLELLGWGTSLGGSFSAGQYKYEVWYNGNVLFQKGIRLYPGSTPLASNKTLEISNVVFGNTDYNNKIIADYGGTLYENEVQYLSPKIYYKGLGASKRSVTLYYRIFLASGDITQGKSSPIGFTSSQNIEVEPGLNSIKLGGWGNANATTYKAGYHKVEFWLDGEKIYETKVKIVKRGEEETPVSSGSSNTKSSSFLMNILTYPMGNTYYDAETSDFDVVKNALSSKYTVKDSSNDNTKQIFLYNKSGEMDYMTYHDMEFYYLYYCSLSGTSSLKGRISYNWKIKNNANHNDILDKIVSDFRSKNIEINYEKKKDDYSTGKVRIGKIEYEIGATTSAVHVTKWFFK